MSKAVRRGGWLAALAFFLFATPAHAAGFERAGVVSKLCAPAGADVPKAVDAIIAGLPDAAPPDLVWAERLFGALSAKKLICAPAGAYLADGFEAVTLTPTTPPAEGVSPLPSLRLRALLQQALAAQTLFADKPVADKLAAVRSLEGRSEAAPNSLLEAALKRQTDEPVRAALVGLLQARELKSPDPARRVAAIAALAADPTARVVTQLAALAASRRTLMIGDALSLLYNGLSAGSVLFLASVGLAAIFGLMGVINLAQGEFIMLGAYTTFCVQEALRAVAPAQLDWYPVLAAPVVFIAIAAVGMALEALAIRRLYQRPLMTLLATWVIGLLIVNLVRLVFGAQNLKIVAPAFISGGDRVTGDFIVTYNHLAAILFASAAFVTTQALLRLTDFGLFVRAVTQNRAMAGGVGSLFGTAIALLDIGLVNVAIEPFYVAVAAKVFTLLVIIALIQWRPEGLIAAKGRR